MTLEHSEPKPIDPPEIARRREVGRRVAEYLSERYGNEFPWIVGHGSFFNRAPYGMTPYPESDVDIQLRAKNRLYRRDIRDGKKNWKYIDWNGYTLVKRHDSDDPEKHFALDILYVDGVKVDVTPFSYESLTGRVESVDTVLKTGKVVNERHLSSPDLTLWLMDAAILPTPIVDRDTYYPIAYGNTERLLERYREEAAKTAITYAIKGIHRKDREAKGLAEIRNDVVNHKGFDEGRKKAFEGGVKNVLLCSRDALLAAMGYPKFSHTDGEMVDVFTSAKNRANPLDSRMGDLERFFVYAGTYVIKTFGTKGLDPSLLYFLEQGRDE